MPGLSRQPLDQELHALGLPDECSLSSMFGRHSASLSHNENQSIRSILDHDHVSGAEPRRRNPMNLSTRTEMLTIVATFVLSCILTHYFVG